MRRKDREVTEASELMEIIDSCKVCRLGIMDGQGVYIVPMNFGYEAAMGELCLYFHSAPEGRKITALLARPEVSFEMDCGQRLMGTGDLACVYGSAFHSVTGRGKVEFLTEPEEKRHALSCLMRHQAGRDFLFTDEMTRAVTVFKITVTEMSGKQNLS